MRYARLYQFPSLGPSESLSDSQTEKFGAMFLGYRFIGDQVRQITHSASVLSHGV